MVKVSTLKEMKTKQLENNSLSLIHIPQNIKEFKLINCWQS